MCYVVIWIVSIFTAVEVCKCQHGMKIVGGKPVQIEAYPYQVSVRYRGRHHCGGSIISDQWILTAAHCVHGRSNKQFKIRAGSTSHKKHGTVHKVIAIVPHTNYNTTTNDYDVALLQVKPRMKLGTVKCNFIRLAKKEPTGGTESMVSGWGTVGVHGMLKQKPEELRAVKVKIVDRDRCTRLFRRYAITERMLCAGHREGGKDACQGDSGGPLVARNALIGVVSWGIGCGNPEFPGVYANVANLREWILNSSGI